MPAKYQYGSLQSTDQNSSCTFSQIKYSSLPFLHCSIVLLCTLKQPPSRRQSDSSFWIVLGNPYRKKVFYKRIEITTLHMLSPILPCCPSLRLFAVHFISSHTPQWQQPLHFPYTRTCHLSHILFKAHSFWEAFLSMLLSPLTMSQHLL